MAYLDDLIKQLIADEGEELSAYQDSLGYWTIGVGHLIDKRKGGQISSEVSRFLLRDDIHLKSVELIRELPWTTSLDDTRFGALVNLAFNMGVEELLTFKKFLGFMLFKQYKQAADELLNSLYAKQLPGRSKRVAKQIETGDWQWQT